MNWQHLRAFMWLRWRLSVNQWRRSGRVNAALMIIVAIVSLLTAVPLLVGCFVLGTYVIPEAAPAHLMYAWDAIIAAFLLFWGIGLLTDLQRSDSLVLSKFLHLPVSPNSAFLINYLSSFVRLSLIVFVPIMLGFALALVYVKGPALLVVLPLLCGFLLMVTALTYQLQGWLAVLMSNPRRRRTVVVAATAVFILVFQLPNLLTVLAPWEPRSRVERARAFVNEMAKLNREFSAHEIDADELQRRRNILVEAQKVTDQQARLEAFQQRERVLRLTNVVLPVGWLPLGVMTAAEGRLVPSILGLAGLAAIGTASLWRAYCTTVGLFLGRATSHRRAPARAIARPPAKRAPGAMLLEARLPGLSEPVSAIALAGLRGVLRAPEAKMMMFAPCIAGVVFGSMLWRARHDIPEPARPLVALGAMAVVLLAMTQMTANQFGFDRDGFRVFVMCAARRRDILLGKNLAFAPLALGLAAIQLVAIQAFCPMRFDRFLAVLPLYVSMFLLFCLFANLLSILTPLYVAPGSLKTSNHKLSTILLQTVMVLFVFPLTQALAFVPPGIEALLSLIGWAKGVPVLLLLSLAECAAVVGFYVLLLRWQGWLLQAREQQILETVTNRAA